MLFKCCCADFEHVFFADCELINLIWFIASVVSWWKFSYFCFRILQFMGISSRCIFQIRFIRQCWRKSTTMTDIAFFVAPAKDVWEKLLSNILATAFVAQTFTSSHTYVIIFTINRGKFRLKKIITTIMEEIGLLFVLNSGKIMQLKHFFCGTRIISTQGIYLRKKITCKFVDVIF